MWVLYDGREIVQKLEQLAVRCLHMQRHADSVLPGRVRGYTGCGLLSGTLQNTALTIAAKPDAYVMRGMKR